MFSWKRGAQILNSQRCQGVLGRLRFLRMSGRMAVYIRPRDGTVWRCIWEMIAQPPNITTASVINDCTSQAQDANLYRLQSRPSITYKGTADSSANPPCSSKWPSASTPRLLLLPHVLLVFMYQPSLPTGSCAPSILRKRSGRHLNAP